jgi:hypothetical protein
MVCSGASSFVDLDSHQVERKDLDSHQSDNLDPYTDPDQHQFADDKPKCVEHDSI